MFVTLAVGRPGLGTLQVAMETVVSSQHSYHHQLSECEINRHMNGGHRVHVSFLQRSHPASDGCLVDTSQPSNRHADDDMGSQGGKHKKYEGPEFITYGMLSQHFNESLSTACEKLGFSRSAIKAACRRLGISKWPYSHSGPRMSKKKKEIMKMASKKDADTVSSKGSCDQDMLVSYWPDQPSPSHSRGNSSPDDFPDLDNFAQRSPRVQRPIPYAINRISFSPEPLTLGSTCSTSWSYQLLKRYWEFGLQADRMLNIFNNLPAQLQHTISFGLATLLNALNSKASKVHPMDGGAEGGAGVSRPDSSMYWLEEDMWNKNEQVAFLRILWDPVNHRRTDFFTNDMMPRLCGIHKEELVTRFASHDAPMCMTDLEFICYIIDDVLNCDKKTLVRYFRYGYWNDEYGPRSVLVQHIKDKQLDWKGRSYCTKHYIRAVSSEEYNEAQRLDPNCTRPLMWSTGDLRRAEELSRDYKMDREQECMENLLATEEGRLKLQLLEEQVKFQVSQMVQNAR